MQTGAITSYIDVAQLALYAFWIFFAGLIFYLRREDRREGYPLERDPADRSGRRGGEVLPFLPGPKTFLLAHGGTATSGNPDRREPAMERVAAWPGSPSQPSGDPMLAAVGPGSYAERADEPELTLEGQPLIVPLAAAPGFSIEASDPDPRGMEVIGADRGVAGTVREIWVDQVEPQIRFLEVELPAPAGSTADPEPEAAEPEGSEPTDTEAAAESGDESKPKKTASAKAKGAAAARKATVPSSVLVPIGFARIGRHSRQIHVQSILAGQFAGAPRVKAPHQITKLEEDKIMAYFAGGTLYAEPRRLEPIL
jgi:photosynthetic reaction center H subunit